MKVIVFKNAEGLECVMSPSYGKRLVKRICFTSPESQPEENVVKTLRALNDAFPGAMSVDYAESEEEFLNRIFAKSEQTATDLRILDREAWEAELAARPKEEEQEPAAQ